MCQTNVFRLMERCSKVDSDAERLLVFDQIAKQTVVLILVLLFLSHIL